MKLSLLKKLWLRTSMLVAVILCGVTTAWGQEVIEIGTVDELKAFRDAVNAGTTYAGKTVKLTADLDLSSETNWKPIGNLVAYPGQSFNGIFDGQNHSISNLTVNDNTPKYATAGLFGSIVNGTIKNLTVKNVNIMSTYYAGGIVAYTSDAPTIENCHVIGGAITTTPEQLDNGNYDNGCKAGGIMGGYAPKGTTINNCTVEDVTITGYRDIGGIVGYSSGTITNNIVKNVTVTQDLTNAYEGTPNTIGDIIGRGSATLSNNTVIKSNPVAQIGETKYETLAEAVAAADAGDVIEIIKAGDYKLPNLPNNVTIEGAVEGVNIDANVAYDSSIASVPNGATFKDLTFNWNDVHYHGFQHAGTINMENCKHNGRFFSYGNMNFTNCEFEYNGDEYCMWVYGSGEVVYDNCTFTNNTKGKLLHLYCEDRDLTHKVTVKDCKFHNNGSLSKSAINVKATSSNGALQYDLYLEGNNTVEGNFPTAVGEQDNADHTWILSPIVQVDDRKVSPDKITVYQDGKKIYPIQISTPTIFHDEGTYEGSLDVAIAGEGTIMYKLNDGEATAYTAPITINATTTVTAWAEKDGVKSNEVTKEFTIEPKQAGAEVADGYYTIQTSDGKYVNVAGRKTVTLASDTKSAGTVIRVSADANGVKVLRSQAVDLPRYAERAMSYVPEIVKEVVNKLAGNVDDPIIGEQGTQLILDKFNKEFDYHLYLEGENNTYRIYGRTPSMKPVVDFYAENKELIDGRLLKVEDFVKEVLQKVVDKVGRGQSVVDMFKVKTIWQNMGGTLTEPTDDASTLKFYEEVLSSEKNVWEFAYQTGMLYWEKVKGYLKENAGSLGDYGKYLEKIPNVRPNFKYYIVPGENGVDIISEGNSQITDASTAWTLTKREGFDITFDANLSKNNGKEMYKSLYVDFAYELPENVKALKVKSVTDAGVAETEEITGVVPAQTAVLLKSTDVENLTKTLKLSTSDGSAVANELKGNDYLINEFKINTPELETIFAMLTKLSSSLGNKYEYLKRKNAGTVNNKYFFGLSVPTDDGEFKEAFMNGKVKVLGDGEKGLGFYSNFDKDLVGNEVFVFTDDANPIPLTLVGDINRDGSITIADVTALVNIILGKATPEKDSDKYDFDAAYVNDDNVITIADVTALVNIILGK